MFLILKAIQFHRREIIRLVGKSNAKILFKAIKNDIPIMVYEENTVAPIDGDLYRSLKALGAKKVYNQYLVMEREKKIKGVIVAYMDISAKIPECLKRGSENNAGS